MSPFNQFLLQFINIIGMHSIIGIGTILYTRNLVLVTILHNVKS